MEWIYKISDFFTSIGEFFVMVWNDEDRWLLIGGLLFFFVGFLLKIVLPAIEWLLYGSGTSGSISTRNSYEPTSVQEPKVMTVIIKGVYQMNGPKPFKQEISIAPSEVGYYSQLMGNKSRQAQWIRANYPGADTDRGFSMSINIK